MSNVEPNLTGRNQNRKLSNSSSDIDLDILRQALQNRDAKLLEWYEPRLSRHIDQLQLDHRKQSGHHQQQTVKLYDRLIFKKSTRLFRKIDTNRRRQWEAFEEEENAFPLGPPLEFYMDINDQHQLKMKFLADLTPGSILIGEIRNWRRNQFQLAYLCMDCGQARYIKNINIMCQINQNNEMLEEGDYVRCVVTGIQGETVIASADQAELTKIDPLLSLKTQLGGLEEKEIPNHHVPFDKGETDGVGLLSSVYSVLENGEFDAFDNPNECSYLLDRLGINPEERLTLLHDSVIQTPKPEQCKQHLRKIQSHECALRFVSKGVEQFKKNECQNAMNYYNEALQADNECVDALVARGCLFSTRKQYPRACEDLEAAYKLDKSHKNAKRYLTTILLEWSNEKSKIAKSKDDLADSMIHLERILELDPDHHEANKKIKILRKPSVFSDINEQIAQRVQLHEEPERRISTEDREANLDAQIRDLLAKRKRKDDRKEKKRKKDKKRKRSRSRDRSRSRSRSPRSPRSRSTSGRNRHNSSSSSVITIDDDRRSRNRSLSASNRKEIPLYVPPKPRYQPVDKEQIKNLDALSHLSSNIKGNLKDILGKLGNR